MANYFKVSTDDVGDNWLIALELWQFSEGAKADAELIVKLLNEYYQKLMESTNGS